jgi:hypothetical protein
MTSEARPFVSLKAELRATDAQMNQHPAEA